MIRLLATGPASAAAGAETAAGRGRADRGVGQRLGHRRRGHSRPGSPPAPAARSRAGPAGSAAAPGRGPAGSGPSPSGSASRRAASAYDRPSRSQSTTASRYRDRQPGDLLVDDAQHVVALGRGCGSHGGLLRDRLAARRLLVRPLPARLGPRPHRHPSGDAVQPGPQPAGVADRAGPLHQHQERRLEGVLDVVRVAEDPPADAQHHRAVQCHQRVEGRLVVPRREPLEQLAVVQPGHRPGVKELPDRRQYRNLPARHVPASASAIPADRLPPTLHHTVVGPALVPDFPAPRHGRPC